MQLPLTIRRLLVHLGLAMLVCWTMLRNPGSHLLGHGDVDIWNHAWGAWWWWESISSGHLPWRTQLLHWPNGGVLWFIDPVLAALGAPLVPILGSIASVNVVLLLYVAFASWAVWRFAESLGVPASARWAASTAYVGSAWLSCELHNGITEAANIGPVAIALAWTEEAARSGSRRDWAKAGLGVGMASIASPYLGLGTGLVVLIRSLPHVRIAWLGGLVALGLTALPTFLLQLQLKASDAIIKHPEAMNDQLSLHNAVDPRVFIQPGFRSVDLSAEGFEHSMYLGWLVLFFAALSWKKSTQPNSPPRRNMRGLGLWTAGAFTCLVMALGPYLFWGGEWLTTGAGGRFRLPWWGLQQLAPGLAITHPLRLAVPALAILAGLAALGVARHVHGVRGLAIAGLILLEGLGLSGSPWPIATTEATAPRVYDSITRNSETLEWGLLDLPTEVASTMRTSRYLFWQTRHRQSIPYAPDARASTNALLNRCAFKSLAKHSTLRTDDAQRLALSCPDTGNSGARSLVDDGIRWIVVHRSIDAEAAKSTIAVLESDLGPGQEIDGSVLWDLQAE